jgi:hypothetical protein
MWKLFESNAAGRFAHMLTQMANIESFTALDEDSRFMATGYEQVMIRFRDQKSLERVINPPMHQGRAEVVKEKVVESPFFKPAVRSFGLRNQVATKKRRTNQGIPFGNITMIIDGETLCLNPTQIAHFCKIFAGAKEQVNLFLNGLDKLTRRFYNTHRNMCTGVNGAYLSQAFGGIFLTYCLKTITGNFRKIIIGFQTKCTSSLAAMADSKKPAVTNYVEIVAVVDAGYDGKGSSIDIEAIYLLYSKLGDRAGSLQQCFPLAAAEQAILDPAQVCVRIL